MFVKNAVSRLFQITLAHFCVDTKHVLQLHSSVYRSSWKAIWWLFILLEPLFGGKKQFLFVCLLPRKFRVNLFLHVQCRCLPNMFATKHSDLLSFMLCRVDFFSRLWNPVCFAPCPSGWSIHITSSLCFFSLSATLPFSTPILSCVKGFEVGYLFPRDLDKTTDLSGETCFEIYVLPLISDCGKGLELC